jgi:hypothetical protein
MQMNFLNIGLKQKTGKALSPKGKVRAGDSNNGKGRRNATSS